MKLVKERYLWVGERRGVAVYVRKGLAGGAGRIVAKELPTEALASELLDAEVKALLADGYALVDPEATIDGPFTLDGSRPTQAELPARYAEYADAVRTFVAGGFLDDDELGPAIDVLINRMVRPPKTLRADLERVGDEARAALRRQVRPNPCVNDAIDRAFDELNRRGVVAIQNAGARFGTSEEDGWADALLVARHRRKAGEVVQGACFYCFPQLVRAVRGEGLQLTFGVWPESTAKAVEIGQLVVDVLRGHGVESTWSGTPAERISIAPFIWYRH